MTSEQVPGTSADKFLGDSEELWLLQIRFESLDKGIDGDGTEGKGELKWEDVGSGCFAHLYDADLGRKNVESVMKIKKEGKWSECLQFAW